MVSGETKPTSNGVTIAVYSSATEVIASITGSTRDVRGSQTRMPQTPDLRGGLRRRFSTTASLTAMLICDESFRANHEPQEDDRRLST